MRKLLAGFLMLGCVSAFGAQKAKKGEECIYNIKCSAYSDGVSNLDFATSSEHADSAKIPDYVYMKIAYKDQSGNRIVKTGIKDYWFVPITPYYDIYPADQNKTRLKNYYRAMQACENLKENIEFQFAYCGNKR